jgi:hypothetical protein
MALTLPYKRALHPLHPLFTRLHFPGPSFTWGKFRSLVFATFPQDSIPLNFVECFNSFASLTPDIPFASIFDSPFPSLILDSIHTLFARRAYDRDLAPYVWLLSIIGRAPTPFLGFFLATDVIPTLEAIATAGYVTSSPSADQPRGQP